MKDLAVALLPLLLGLLLLVAAWGDIRSRTIPNALNATIALLAVPWWWATDISLWPGVPIELAIAGGIFVVFSIFFMFGWMGGGDVKLLTALSLWLLPAQLMLLLTVMALAGGAITLVMLIARLVRQSKEEPEVPYGVAIAFAGLLIIAERYLNHFA
ncbi:A24 family peptidase [Flavisphingomonas formosensis]|uniref:A24 family peptidase n=1 Tax=Flavisphingomonas formosensis TaxID=861534 RepID=UPI0012F79764|nr:prepilin peptidase [Sphingomonas formosensis]